MSVLVLDRESTWMSNVKYRNVIPTTKSTIREEKEVYKSYNIISSRYASRRNQSTKAKVPLYSPSPTFWTPKFVVPFFSRHMVVDVVEGLATRLYPQRTNTTSTPALFPPHRRLVERPTAKPEPEPWSQDHRLVYSPHPEQCE